jgi:predicted dithiol-disulfide oxidoreductase (DUF899 family)
MIDQRIGTREEWEAAREQLLVREKKHTRLGDELAQQRRDLPWVPVDKDYRFDTEDGEKTLAELFDGRSQLLMYHFMFGPSYEAGDPVNSSIADAVNAVLPHLRARDVTFVFVSQAPLERLKAYEGRMGWSFPWASSFGGDFNYDFQAGHAKEAWDAGAVEHNFRVVDLRPPAGEEGSRNAWTEAIVGTDWETYRREGPGMSAFALEDGAVYHTYSTYARGLDGLWGMYQWLDRAPRGRNEAGFWWRRHDEYDAG